MERKFQNEFSELVLNGVFVLVSAVFAAPFGIIVAWYAFGV